MDTLNKSILTLTNLLKQGRYKKGDRKKDRQANYNYPRTNPPGGTYNKWDVWAYANYDGRFSGNQHKKNPQWKKAAQAVWAKFNSSGKDTAYERETGKSDKDAKGGTKKLGGTGKKQAQNSAKAAGTIYTPKANKTYRQTMKKAVPENNYTGAQKRAAERKTLNAMRRKSTDMNSYDELKGFWKDNSDTYTKRKPVALNVEKDHALVPPRQGNVWDAVKHRWVSPDNYGKNVTDVQGKAYRARAGGAGGQGKKSVGGHGGGVQRRITAGRKHRHFSDTGARTAHETIRTKAGKTQRTARKARRFKTKG